MPARIKDILRQSNQDMNDAKLAELDNARIQVEEKLGPDALDADGNLDDKYKDTPVGSNYTKVHQIASHLKLTEDLHDEVYDHLASFFARYECGGGDIVPRRRHSSHGRYAIPYNGEEVLLHWVNYEQYYIKTDAYNPHMAFKYAGQRFQFRITDSKDIPRDNNKGSDRFMLPQIAEITEEDDGDIIIPFIFCSLDKEQKKTFKKQSKNKNGNDGDVQLGILEAALGELRAAANKNKALIVLLEKNNDIPVFMLHAKRFVRRNNADFFIHHNLRGFLTHELEFYIKSEMLNLEELMHLNGGGIESRMTVLRAVNDLGISIIDALAQWEDFQKSLWEKRKFVLQTEYCFSLGKIPKFRDAGLINVIAECDDQWQEWNKLGIIEDNSPMLGRKNKKDRVAYLKSHKSLPVDTSNFLPGFKDELLAQFKDIEESIDGILIQGENWQALNLIQEKYQNSVKCIYIDPPYNAPASEVLYKNDFKHSSWMSLMYDRLVSGYKLLHPAGVMSIAIDDYEFVRLMMLVEQILPNHDIYPAIVKHHGAGGAGTNLSKVHEYNIFVVPKNMDILKGRMRYDPEDRAFMRTGTAESNSREGRPNSFYSLLVDMSTNKVVGAEKPPKDGDDYPREDTSSGLKRFYPITTRSAKERVWRRSYESVGELIDLGLLELKGKTIIHKIDHNGSPKPLKSIWESKNFNAGSYGTNLLKDLFGDKNVFSYPKSIHTVKVAIDASTFNLDNYFVLDYFAGSGTTAHAVIELNRENHRRRKFILVESGEHFNTAILPRIKKIIYSPEWKKGKPVREASDLEFEDGPCLIKYQRIESYEDSLCNIKFDDAKLDFDRLTPSYELDFESRNSPTKLIDSMIDTPFNYEFEIMVDTELNGEKTSKVYVDLPETFSYLAGFSVKTQNIIFNNGHKYLIQRGDQDGKNTVVFWRDIYKWKAEDFKREKAFINKEGLVDGAVNILFNGNPAIIPKAESLNPVFARCMFLPTTR